jgi:hypothetical protein
MVYKTFHQVTSSDRQRLVAATVENHNILSNNQSVTIGERYNYLINNKTHWETCHMFS